VRLDSVARSLAARGALRLVIEGYTDPRGGKALNAGLSRRRAEAVATFLTGAGLDLTSATLKAMGPATTSANPTKEEMAMARRVNLRFFEADGREVAAERDSTRDRTDLQLESELPAARRRAAARAAKPSLDRPARSPKKSSTKPAPRGAR